MDLEKENLELKIRLTEVTAQLLQFQLNVIGEEHKNLIALLKEREDSKHESITRNRSPDPEK